MEYYADGDYAKAIGGLRNAASASPSTPAYSFYLGACYLLTRQVDHAVDALRNTVALGDSPYLESAHFLLGKAHLVEGRMLAAKEELQTTIRLRGSNEAEARDILGQLPK
jgi:tetratricopeptide (TPR) repeat protein